MRSERQFCEQLGYNLLFRWFLDMDMVEPTFDATVFTKNRERLLAHDVAGEFFRAVVAHAQKAKLMSSEHFTVDGTLIEACASLKSFKKKGSGHDDEPPPDDPGNPTVNFHGEKRSNETHESATDPEAKLARKGFSHEAKLSYSAHALMENRNGLLVDFRIAEANGTAECETALPMIDENKLRSGPVTIGADKGYDTHDFVAECRAMNVVPHIAQCITAHRGPAIDARTTQHAGYSISQRVRKRVEEIFGWGKCIAGRRRDRVAATTKRALPAMPRPHRSSGQCEVACG